MKLKHLVSGFVLLSGLLMGCGFFRYEIIPQSNQGPHGGPMVLIDERFDRYIEFVAAPQGDEWLLQLYAYNSKMRPIDFESYATAEIVTTTDKKESVNLYDEKHWFLPWSPAGHLEGKVILGDTSQLKVKIILFHSKSNLRPDELYFEYSYPTQGNHV